MMLENCITRYAVPMLTKMPMIVHHRPMLT